MTDSRGDWPRPAVADVGTAWGRAALNELALRPVLLSDDVVKELGDRVEWGEPDADGWYTPTLYRSSFTKKGH